MARRLRNAARWVGRALANTFGCCLAKRDDYEILDMALEDSSSVTSESDHEREMRNAFKMAERSENELQQEFNEFLEFSLAGQNQCQELIAYPFASSVNYCETMKQRNNMTFSALITKTNIYIYMIYESQEVCDILYLFLWKNLLEALRIWSLRKYALMPYIFNNMCFEDVFSKIEVLNDVGDETLYEFNKI